MRGMCAGVVPQQPPRIRHRARRLASEESEIYSFDDFVSDAVPRAWGTGVGMSVILRSLRRLAPENGKRDCGRAFNLAPMNFAIFYFAAARQHRRRMSPKIVPLRVGSCAPMGRPRRTNRVYGQDNFPRVVRFRGCKVHARSSGEGLLAKNGQDFLQAPMASLPPMPSGPMEPAYQDFTRSGIVEASRAIFTLAHLAADFSARQMFPA